MWYRDLDKARIVPLYLLHRKRYYDWFGTKALQATVDMMANKPKEKWRYILKKMCKLGVVDSEYIRKTCDMSWVTEDCFTTETDRYIQRYIKRPITTDADTTISSIGYDSVISMSQKTGSTHTVASDVKKKQAEDQLRRLDEVRVKLQEERKRFQDEQNGLLLAQQLQFEEQRKQMQEEQTKALEEQQTALLEKFMQTMMNNKLPEPLIIDPQLNSDVLPSSVTNNRTSRENTADMEALRQRE